MQKFFAIALTAFILAFLMTAGGCGQFFPSSTTITALQVLPSNSTFAPGVTQQYTATATYGNMSSADATSSVTWSVSPTTYATITSGGLLTAVAAGTATVQASSGGVVGKTAVTVTNQNQVPSSVSITPTTPLPLSLSAGPTTLQFTATATFSNGSMANVTANATWTCIPSTVATISSTGLVTAISVGTATVSATASGVTSNSATVTVNQ